MKYGILVHKSCRNIGDDIQAYAASQFLPSIDYMITREHINEFKSENNEPVAVIMNAWWMWKKWNWPPASCIVPKLISMHYTDKLTPQGATPLLNEPISGPGLEYFKAHEPVGCRDNYTKEVFAEKGIDAYFSGCVTLTLPKAKKRELEREYICLADVDPASEKKIRKLLENENIEIKNVTHVDKVERTELTWEDRVKEVEGILELYQNAKCVVTKRLHAALPCLAMEVPVFVIFDKLEDTRFNPFVKFLYCATPQDFKEDKYDYDFINPKPNKTVYLEYRNKLIVDLTAFIEETKKWKAEEVPVYVPKYNEYELIKWQNSIMSEALDKWFIINKETNREIRKLQKEIRELKKKNKPTKSLLQRAARFIRKTK